jgi:predicted ATPase
MLAEIAIQNFKSIRDQRVRLNQLNLLIGQNGAGKSNFISLFKFLERLAEQQLASYVYGKGGIENFLFGGFGISSFLKVRTDFRIANSVFNTYEFSILSRGKGWVLAKRSICFTKNTNH